MEPSKPNSEDEPYPPAEFGWTPERAATRKLVREFSASANVDYSVPPAPANPNPPGITTSLDKPPGGKEERIQRCMAAVTADLLEVSRDRKERYPNERSLVAPDAAPPRPQPTKET